MKRGPKSKAEVESLEKERQYRDGLIAQLSARNAATPYFVELVDELIFQRGILRELKALIAAGGIVEVSKDGKGALKVSMSSMLRELRDTEKNILLIFKELRITTDSVIPDDEEAQEL